VLLIVNFCSSALV